MSGVFEKMSSSYNSRFIVGKMPEIPQMDDLFNGRIDNNEYIMDRGNLEAVKDQIDKVMQ